MYKVNEVTLEPFTLERVHDERPFNSIKGFSQIYFVKKSCMIPGREPKRVNYFLGKNYICGDEFGKHVCSLEGVLLF